MLPDIIMDTPAIMLTGGRGKGKGRFGNDNTLLFGFFIFWYLPHICMCIYTKWIEKGTEGNGPHGYGLGRKSSKGGFHLLVHKLLRFEFLTMGN